MEKERDTFNELFRSKLHDFEVDTMPSDWEAIADRLPVKAPVSFLRTLRYWAAAAVISLLMITGGMYVFKSGKGVAPLANQIEQETKKIEKASVKEAEVPVAQAVSVEEKRLTSPVAEIRQPVVREVHSAAEKVADMEPVVKEITHDTVAVAVQDVVRTSPEVVPEEDTHSLLADAVPVGKKKDGTARRRWGIGMGGGNMTTGTNSSLNTYALRNTPFTDQELLFLNAANFENAPLKTNIRHNTSFSLGMVVSYSLNNRFALVSGLNYSLLSSSWETEATYHNKTNQKLHFIGIPLYLTYKIAEWKRFHVYAAAGLMTEVNVAGKLVTKKYMHEELYKKESDPIRMKEWMWSVNARTGVSYPLFRFVSLYAEVGADYYFDNGSTIETVRSEKPFNVNLQAGFRLGF